MEPVEKLSGGRVLDLVAGGGLGVLFGLLVGLTTTPVVASVLASLVALAVAFVGLSESAPAGISPATPLRLAVFSLCAAIFVLAGIYVRTHGLLSPSAASISRELTEAGFDPEEAKDLVRLRLFGVMPEGATTVAPDNLGGRVAASTLFSADAEDCRRLLQDRRLDQPQRIASLLEMSPPFRKVGERLQNTAPERRGPLLEAAEFYLCDLR